MVYRGWVPAARRSLICVDAYENSVLQGRIFDPGHNVEAFSSLAQFLLQMEELLDRRQDPQAYTQARKFSSLLIQPEQDGSASCIRKGKRATFELQILFRQHSSWQGILLWKETGMEQSFRSVLELVILMDSALRDLERRAGA